MDQITVKCQFSVDVASFTSYPNLRGVTTSENPDVWMYAYLVTQVIDHSGSWF